MAIYKKGSTGSVVKQIQTALYAAGYPCGVIDGKFGQLTEEAVMEFQRDKQLKVDGIVGPATLSKLLSSTPDDLAKSKRTITELFVHCSDTPEGKDYTVADIRRWHLDRGFSDIGYHYIIYRDGTIHKGRDVNISGAHVEGHNSHSIGICYIGGAEATLDKNGKIVAKKNSRGHNIAKDTRTAKQKEALAKLLKDLRKLYPKAKIYGHRDFAKKECPCFDAKAEYKYI